MHAQNGTDHRGPPSIRMRIQFSVGGKKRFGSTRSYGKTLLERKTLKEVRISPGVASPTFLGHPLISHLSRQTTSSSSLDDQPSPPSISRSLSKACANFCSGQSGQRCKIAPWKSSTPTNCFTGRLWRWTHAC